MRAVPLVTLTVWSAPRVIEPPIELVPVRLLIFEEPVRGVPFRTNDLVAGIVTPPDRSIDEPSAIVTVELAAGAPSALLAVTVKPPALTVVLPM